MPEPLLNVLKLCLLALLYLFFLRVLRAVWSEISVERAPATVGPSRSDRRADRRGRRKPARLTVVEPAEQRGSSYDLGEEVTVGRAAGCQVTLDDNYVSQLHARVFSRDGSWYVEDLGSTNGTYLNTRRVTGATPMKRGDRLKIGATVLEVRA